MIGEYAVIDWLKYLVSKWKLIIVVVLVCVLAFVGMRVVGLQPTITSHPIVASQMIEFKNHVQYASAEGVLTYRRYDDIWMRNPILNEFVQKIQQEYNMADFNPKWEEMSDSEKAQWIRTCYVCNPMLTSPNYEITLKTSISPDSELTSEPFAEKWNALFDDFITFIGEATYKYVGDNSMVRHDFAIQQGTPAPKDSPISLSLLVKHSILGGAFGFILAVFIASIMFLSTAKLQSAALVQSRYGLNALHINDSSLSDAVYFMVKARAGTSLLLDMVGAPELQQGLLDAVHRELGSLSVLNFTNNDSLIAADEMQIISCTQICRTGEIQDMIRQQEGRSVVLLADESTSKVLLLAALESSTFGAVVAQIGKTNKREFEQVMRTVQAFHIKTPLSIIWKE